MRLHLSLVALALLGDPAMAAPERTESYLLSMHFDDGNGLRGNPRVRVRAGEPAMVTVGDSGRRLTIRVTAVARADGLLNMRSAIETVAGDGTVRRAVPALLVRPNETAAIELGALSTSAQPVRVTFNFQPL